MRKDANTRQSRAKKPNKPTPRAKAPSPSVSTTQSADTAADIPHIPSKFEPALLKLNKRTKTALAERLRQYPNTNTLGNVLSELGFRKGGEATLWLSRHIVYPISTDDIQNVFHLLFENFNEEDCHKFFSKPCSKPTDSNLKQIKAIDPSLDGEYSRHNAWQMDFPFQNGILRVHKGKPLNLIPYDKYNKLVSVESLIPHSIDITEETLCEAHWQSGHFYRLTLNQATDPNNHTFDPDLHRTIMNGIAKCCHWHHNQSDPCAVIFSEQVETWKQNSGRTGKGILVQAIRHMTPACAMISGKQFNSDYSHAFQSVTRNTRLVYFDETKDTGSVLISLFTCLTDGWKPNPKHKPEFFIAAKDGPRVVITTNSAKKGTDDSFLDRRFDVPLTRFYNANHKPVDDFGYDLFGPKWSKEEWNKFFITMAFACQHYLDQNYGERPMPRCHKAQELIEQAFEEEIDADLADFLDQRYGNDIAAGKPFDFNTTADMDAFAKAYPVNKSGITNSKCYLRSMGKWLASRQYKLVMHSKPARIDGKQIRMNSARPIAMSQANIAEPTAQTLVPQHDNGDQTA